MRMLKFSPRNYRGFLTYLDHCKYPRVHSVLLNTTTKMLVIFQAMYLIFTSFCMFFLGSPFKLYVDSIPSGYVTAYGPGLISGVSGEPCLFTISTKGAGAGKL